MFKTGDTVLYGSEGVCKIEDITVRTFGESTIEYYVLTPLYNSSSTFFVPTANQKLTARMRHLLSCDEIMDIVRTADGAQVWTDDETIRKEKFKEILAGGNLSDTVSVLKALIGHKNNMEKNGKKLHKSDETIYKEAQKILYEEFALVMDITKDEILDIVCEK